MDFDFFKEKINLYKGYLNMDLDDIQILHLYNYMNMLIEKNKVMNLTRIIEPREIIIKHFIDSLTILKYINKNDKIIDIGTGAGFPGIPLKIAEKSLDITLLDSLNKRINFLNEVIESINLTKISAIHGRAEDFGNNFRYREKFNIAVSRAVAPLNVLLEYMLPFVELNGKCICMKGSNCDEEINASKNAIKVLGGKIEKIEKFNLANTDNFRTIIIIRKIKKTDEKYPRNAGIPTKKPL